MPGARGVCVWQAVSQNVSLCHRKGRSLRGNTSVPGRQSVLICTTTFTGRFRGSCNERVFLK